MCETALMCGAVFFNNTYLRDIFLKRTALVEVAQDEISYSLNTINHKSGKHLNRDNHIYF